MMEALVSWRMVALAVTGDGCHPPTLGPPDTSKALPPCPRLLSRLSFLGCTASMCSLGTKHPSFYSLRANSEKRERSRSPRRRSRSPGRQSRRRSFSPRSRSNSRDDYRRGRDRSPMTGTGAPSGGSSAGFGGQAPHRSYEERAAAREQMMSNIRETSQQDRRVYVGNLSYDVKWHHLKDFMRQGTRPTRMI
jgi:hypothetical protein